MSAELEALLTEQLEHHTPGSRAFCQKVASQIAPVLTAHMRQRAEYRLALLSAVVSFVDVNHGDLPLTLLESIRVEIDRRGGEV